MGNESLNILKSAGKNIMNEIASELSESGIKETLIKNGIPINRLMPDSSKRKNQSKINTNKSSNKKKQDREEEKPENSKEKQPVQKKISVPKIKDDSKNKFSASEVTKEQLRDAVIWSEILGKPVSRKRKNRRSLNSLAK